MEHGSTFLPLLLITLLAAVVPVLVNRLPVVRLPGVVGEILAGMVIGQSGFDLVEPSATLDFLAEFGFTFLMFLSGLEVNFSLLFGATGVSEPNGETQPRGAARWRRPVPLAGLNFALTLALGLATGLALVTLGLAQNPILMGLILSTTSLGIVVPVLKERKLTATRYGQALLAAALVSDFGTLLLLSVAIAAISQGLSLDLLLFMLLLAAFVAAAKVGQWATRNRALTRIAEELSQATSQVRVRGAFALMIAWVVLSQALGVEVILGAFLAGAVVSMSSQRTHSPLREKLDAIGYGFFIPIFFIMVGARFDLSALVSSPSALLLVPVLILAAYLLKMLPSLLFKTAFPWRETLAAGALLSSRLSLIIAASAIALDLNLISSATNAAVVLVAVVTCTLSPVLFSRILPQQEERKRAGTIILGTDQLARLLAARLRRSGEAVTFVSRDTSQLARLAEEGFQVVEGNPDSDSVLGRAGAARARALIAVPTRSDLMVEVCRLARDRFGVPQVIARADDTSSVQQLQAIGVRVIQPSIATALALEGALFFPATYDVLLDKTDDVELLDVPLGNARLAGQSLRRLRLPGNALVLGIRRDGEVVVPHGDTVLQVRDTIMLIGSAEALAEAEQLLRGDEGGSKA